MDGGRLSRNAIRAEQGSLYFNALAGGDSLAFGGEQYKANVRKIEKEWD